MTDTTPTTTTKPKWASKTLWVNGIALLAAVLSMFGLGDYLTADIQANIIAAVMGVVNIILRFMTKEAIV